MIRQLLVLLALALSAQAVAGDVATLSFYGFSRDGRYMAFEQHGVQDGSGFPFSEVFVVNVPRNLLVYQKDLVLQTEADTSDPARTKLAATVKPVLERYGIVRGNVGKQPTQSGTNTNRVTFTHGREYTLSLRQVAQPTTKCILETEHRLELMLSRPGLQMVLQRDSRLPTSRACTQSYAIYTVHVYNAKLVVFIRRTRDGFEGPDTRWMVVTGVLR